VGSDRLSGEGAGGCVDGGLGWWINAGPESLVEEGVHLCGRCRAPVMKPPVEQGEERTGAGVGQGRATCGRQVVRWGKRGEALVNGASEMSLAELHDVANLLGGRHRGNKRTHLGDVGEELLDGSDAVGSVVVADEGGRHHFEEIFDVAEEEIVFVAVVRIKGGSADFGAIEDALDGDAFEWLLVHERDEGISECVSRDANARVHFLFGGHVTDILCGCRVVDLFCRWQAGGVNRGRGTGDFW